MYGIANSPEMLSSSSALNSSFCGSLQWSDVVVVCDIFSLSCSKTT